MIRYLYSQSDGLTDYLLSIGMERIYKFTSEDGIISIFLYSGELIPKDYFGEYCIMDGISAFFA